MFAASPSLMLCRPWPNRKTQLSWGDSEKVGLHAILAKSHSSQKSKKNLHVGGPDPMDMRLFDEPEQIVFLWILWLNTFQFDIWILNRI